MGCCLVCDAGWCGALKARVGMRCTLKVRTLFGHKGSGIITAIDGPGPDDLIKFQRYGVFRNSRQSEVLCCRHEITVHRK